MFRSKQHKLTPSWILASSFLVIGVVTQYGLLTIVDRSITSFPTVRDVFLEWLPRIDFGIYGEMYFFALLAATVYPIFRYQSKHLPRIVLALGVFYIVRGVIQLLFPIGPPIDGPPIAERISIWGFERHAFFPAGHIGSMTIMLYFSNSTFRKWLILGAFVFALGTAMARTHYTVDSIMGVVLGYAVAVWIERRWD